MHLSSRVANIKPSPTLSVSKRATELKAQGKPIIDLSLGEPDFDTPESIKQAAILALKQGFTKYTAVEGILPLRQAIVEKFAADNHLNYTPHQILVSTGAKQCLINLMLALLNPEDEMILPAPYWVSYPDMASLAGAKTVVIRTEIEQQFKITASQLKAAITPKTRLVVLNSPSNPTGMAYSKAEMKSIGEVLLRNPDIMIVTDDIYEKIYWKSEPFSNKILRRVTRVTIYPKSHYVTPRQRVIEAAEAIKLELQERLPILEGERKLVEAQRLEQRTRFDLEMLFELGYCSGIENYSRHLSGRQVGQPPPTLMDYLPRDAMLIIDESHVTLPQLGGMYKGDRSRKETLVNYGFRLPSALDNRPLRFDEFEAIQPQTIYVSATPGEYELKHSGTAVEQLVRPTGLIDPGVEIRPASTQVDDALSEINKCIVKGERVLITTLTKRMAEDLTGYLASHGIKVRYLHSDIDTVTRVEIIRELRLGVFDVLIGINLLREGLDMPEVSLVAIFDADKEGFLRSSRSLIQTIGRAARHINGRAILYADKVTAAMKQALSETDRRREKQIQYNEKHNITPRGIAKAIKEILEVDHSGEGMLSPHRSHDSLKLPLPEELALSPKALSARIKTLEESMYKHAKNLEFEEAARLRDDIQRLKKLFEI